MAVSIYIRAPLKGVRVPLKAVSVSGSFWLDIRQVLSLLLQLWVPFKGALSPFREVSVSSRLGRRQVWSSYDLEDFMAVVVVVVKLGGSFVWTPPDNKTLMFGVCIRAPGNFHMSRGSHGFKLAHSMNEHALPRNHPSQAKTTQLICASKTPQRRLQTLSPNPPTLNCELYLPIFRASGPQYTPQAKHPHAAMINHIQIQGPCFEPHLYDDGEGQNYEPMLWNT